MIGNQFRLSALVMIVLLFSNVIIGQSKTDTIYFDENWSICEKPVALYHRICTLNLVKSIFYIGNVNDYYENGVLAMSGNFNDKGIKNGLFKFYRTDGSLQKEGNFENGEMKGIWNYYNPNGKLQVQFDCKSAVDFTPILVISNTGDTLIKNGNGHFIFNTQNDLPQIFPSSVNYTVEGSISNSKKNGQFFYWIGQQTDKKKVLGTETFKNGEFKKGSNGFDGTSRDMPTIYLNLLAESPLGNTDNFEHSNVVFGYGNEGDQKLIDFLANGTIPEMQSASQSYQENIKDIYNIIGTVMRQTLKSDKNKNINYSFPPEGISTNIYSFSHPLSPTNKPKEIHFTATLTIDANGYVTNSVFKGNLGKEEIGKMNYYLSRLSGLKPLLKNGQPINSELKIGFISLFDESLNNPKNEKMVGCRYIAYNADSTDMKQVNNTDPVALSEMVDKPAEPVGGNEGLKKYLERNLNAFIPTERGAPFGYYSVKVSFMVNEDGKLTDVKAENDPGYGTAQEAVKVISKMPNWIPARKNGKASKYFCNQSITFVVNKE